MSSPSTVATRVSPELRAAIYHFAVFGSTGVSSVYFGIWLVNRGISPDEIGIINAAPLILMLLINQLVGRIADRARDWRGVIIALSLMAGVVPILLFFVSGFWGVLFVWVLSVMPAFALVPVIVRGNAANDTAPRYRFQRGPRLGHGGLHGHRRPVRATYRLVRRLGVRSGVCCLRLAAHPAGIPTTAVPVGETRAEPQARKGASRLRQVLKPWFLAALLGVAILYATHGVMGAFGAVLWTEQGIPQGLICLLVAVMAASEAAMMFVWSRLKLKVPARHIIIFACLVAAFRWTAMAFSPPVWVLFLLQTLHSITFAMGYLGGIYFLANWTSEDIAAEAQGFSYVLQQAMTVLIILVMGWCVAAFGPMAWLFVGGFSLIGAAFVFLSLPAFQPKSANPVAADKIVVAEPAP